MMAPKKTECHPCQSTDALVQCCAALSLPRILRDCAGIPSVTKAKILTLKKFSSNTKFAQSSCDVKEKIR